MADGAIVNIGRNPPSSPSQQIESIEQSRGDATARLVQTIYQLPLTHQSVTVTHNPKGSAGAPVTVTTSASKQTLADANEKRVSLWITNSGSVMVYLCFSGSAATTNMHPLAPGFTLVYTITTGEVNAITASSSAVVNVTEFVLV